MLACVLQERNMLNKSGLSFKCNHLQDYNKINGTEL